MQLGMIGLGRMGANMVRRLMRRRPRLRRLRHRSRERSQDAGRRKARSAPPRSRTSSAKLTKPRGRLADGAGGGRRQRRSPSSLPLLEPGDIVIDGGNSYYLDDIRRAEARSAEGHPLRRRRHQRRRLGAGARLLPDDRRRPTSVGAAARSDLRDARAGHRRRRAHAGPREARRHRRARLSALRAERRRPLRQDGPQRHRVRPHGRLCRGPEHPASTPTSASASTHGRRRDHAAARSRALPVRPRTCATSPRSGGAAA